MLLTMVFSIQERYGNKVIKREKECLDFSR